MYTSLPLLPFLPVLFLLLTVSTPHQPKIPKFTRTLALPLRLSRIGSITGCGYNLGPVYLGRALDDPLNTTNFYYVNLEQQHQISSYHFLQCFKYSQQLPQNQRYIVMTQYGGSDKNNGNRLYRIKGNMLQRVSLPLIDDADVSRALVGHKKMGFQIFITDNDTKFYIIDKASLQVQTVLQIYAGGYRCLFDCYDNIIQKYFINNTIYVTVLHGEHYQHSYKFHITLDQDIFPIDLQDRSICLSSLINVKLQLRYHRSSYRQQLRTISIIYNTTTHTPIDFSLSPSTIYSQTEQRVLTCGPHRYAIDFEQKCIQQNGTCVIDIMYTTASTMLCQYAIQEEGDRGQGQKVEKVQIIIFEHENHTDYKQLSIYEGVYRKAEKGRHHMQWVKWVVVGVVGLIVLGWVLGWVMVRRKGVKFGDYVRCRCWGRRREGSSFDSRGGKEGRDRVDLKASIIEDNEESGQ